MVPQESCEPSSFGLQPPCCIPDPESGSVTRKSLDSEDHHTEVRRRVNRVLRRRLQSEMVENWEADVKAVAHLIKAAKLHAAIQAEKATLLAAFSSADTDQSCHVEVTPPGKSSANVVSAAVSVSSDAQDLIEVVIEWPANTTTSCVLACFEMDRWTCPRELTRAADNSFNLQVMVPANKPCTFKFIVDGKWCINPGYPTSQDDSHNVNNVIYPVQISFPSHSPDTPITVMTSLTNWATTSAMTFCHSSRKFTYRTRASSPDEIQFKFKLQSDWALSPCHTTTTLESGIVNNSINFLSQI